ncbi:hypothetical protein PPERSA_06434 [Pseudocohnilembus persalinus]|uniref:Uncharacterized protein n=1 Tax=Pseudocohnilembus persalinus TaxID=266149 RepID=A0A0V0QS13_PSEPJ|nr:hypothetical protein PPERSA_06434 [Pseudocohnilembus persalinus]|eukprot:KRX04800.1 hypothetical protein PPERSA_06434 [Pseudocohnilembus persalinus]
MSPKIKEQIDNLEYDLNQQQNQTAILKTPENLNEQTKLDINNNHHNNKEQQKIQLSQISKKEIDSIIIEEEEISPNNKIKQNKENGKKSVVVPPPLKIKNKNVISVDQITPVQFDLLKNQKSNLYNIQQKKLIFNDTNNLIRKRKFSENLDVINRKAKVLESQQMSNFQNAAACKNSQQQNLLQNSGFQIFGENQDFSDSTNQKNLIYQQVGGNNSQNLKQSKNSNKVKRPLFKAYKSAQLTYANPNDLLKSSKGNSQDSDFFGFQLDVESQKQSQKSQNQNFNEKNLNEEMLEKEEKLEQTQNQKQNYYQLPDEKLDSSENKCELLVLNNRVEQINIGDNISSSCNESNLNSEKAFNLNQLNNNNNIDEQQNNNLNQFGNIFFQCDKNTEQQQKRNAIISNFTTNLPMQRKTLLFGQQI